MECQQCGYMLDAFENECPRCARMKANGITPPQPTQDAVLPQAQPTAPNAMRPTPPRPLAMQRSMASRPQQPMASQRQWTYYASLVTSIMVMLGDALIVFFVALMNSFVLQLAQQFHGASDGNGASIFNFACAMLVVLPILQLVGAIAYLARKRWGAVTYLLTFSVEFVFLILSLFGIAHAQQQAAASGGSLYIANPLLPWLIFRGVPVTFAILDIRTRWDELM